MPASLHRDPLAFALNDTAQRECLLGEMDRGSGAKVVGWGFAASVSRRPQPSQKRAEGPISVPQFGHLAVSSLSCDSPTLTE